MVIPFLLNITPESAEVVAGAATGAAIVGARGVGAGGVGAIVDVVPNINVSRSRFPGPTADFPPGAELMSWSMNEIGAGAGAGAGFAEEVGGLGGSGSSSYSVVGMVADWRSAIPETSRPAARSSSTAESSTGISSKTVAQSSGYSSNLENSRARCWSSTLIFVAYPCSRCLMRGTAFGRRAASLTRAVRRYSFVVAVAECSQVVVPASRGHLFPKPQLELNREHHP